MTTISTLFSLLTLLATSNVHAATKDEWRSRSIYQPLTDRFAPPTENAPCNVNDRVYCGGTYQTIISKLDYIQGMGFDAIWISPVGLNLEGDTEYGYAYHGFWGTDPTKLNPHFGSADDLTALSSAVHSRGMYLMLDLALNDLVSESTTITDAQLQADANGTLLFKSESNYHLPCNIDWGNHTSEQTCWLSTSGVPLMDLATETDAVANVFTEWIPGFVSQYNIDGFRLDAAKHMDKTFVNKFCTAAGVFCMGEVAGDNTQYAATYQGDGGIDSVLGFGMMYGLVAAFTGSSPDMSKLPYYINLAASSYPDPTVIGTFLDNQDLPRFNSLTGDKSLVYNAVVAAFMYGGIPAIYYGTEQDISDGSADPNNREPLWQYNDYSTTATQTYGRIATLNKIRSALATTGNFTSSVASIVASQSQDIALSRGGALIVLTNRGASGSGEWAISQSTFAAGATVYDLLSCSQATVGSDGSLSVTWSIGQPFSSSASATGVALIASSISSAATTTSAIVSSTTVSPASSSESGAASNTSTSSAPAKCKRSRKRILNDHLE